MSTENCLYCENAFDNMKGKLFIEVKAPDGEVVPTKICVSEIDGLFGVTLISGSTFCYKVDKEMKIYARISNQKSTKVKPVLVKPDEFTHLILGYDYYYYKNQIRAESAELKRVVHKTSEDLYNIKK